jgi:hypothetical protein
VQLVATTNTLADKLNKTKGIVLRTVKYGETSLIVLILTEKFGIQSYLVNGVRISTKKGSGKATLFQPSAILDLVVYHSELKQLQRLKEFKWNYLYQNIFSDIKKNAVALFMIELLTRCLKQPEANEELFDGSYVKAHQHSAGAAGQETQAIGKSRAGNATKFHLAVDGYGLPVEFEVTGGEVNDCSVAPDLIARLPGARAIVADKGYDCESIREQIPKKGAQAVIPRKRNSLKGNADMD